MLGLLGVLIVAAPTALAQGSFLEVMGFAADMAQRGNWREARYRWELAAKRYPDHRKILNNLAVASETLGDPQAARAYYEKALAAGRDEAIAANFHRSERFWRRADQDGNASTSSAPASGPKVRGKTVKVTVELPVPARLDVTAVRALLVVSFLVDENAMLDINRELVRYLRSEFRKNVDFEVLAIAPPPAVPEQTLEDLIGNAEFWKHLGREYGADLIVSGTANYDRRDASGFRDVDVVSPTTGQKLRRSQFIEQEQFTYRLEIIFMDGATGELRFRDRLQRSAVFNGTQNDPITAFYDLCDSIAPDILAIVRPRQQEDVRFIFRK